MISVVIPVLDHLFLTENLLKFIDSNIVKPKEVIIIDNASKEDVASLVGKFKELNIVYLKQQKNVGVNESWNIGIKNSTGDLISILNNDIIITPFFFEYIQKVMQDKKIGICVPNTVTNKLLVLSTKTYEKLELQEAGKREGWAFTIRASLAKEFYPIPPRFKMFFGDDFLFSRTRQKGFLVMKMLTNPIFHYGSVTLHDSLGEVETFKLLSQERRFWQDFSKSITLK